MSDPALGLTMLMLIVVVIMMGFPTAFTLMGLGMFFGFIAFYNPSEAFLDNRAGSSLRQCLADPQPAARRMRRAVCLREPADPAASRVVAAMTTERVVHVIDERQRERLIARLAGRLREPEEVANRECVGPQIPPLRGRPSDPRTLGEPQHQLDHVRRAAI